MQQPLPRAISQSPLLAALCASRQASPLASPTAPAALSHTCSMRPSWRSSPTCRSLTKHLWISSMACQASVPSSRCCITSWRKLRISSRRRGSSVPSRPRASCAALRASSASHAACLASPPSTPCCCTSSARRPCSSPRRRGSSLPRRPKAARASAAAGPHGPSGCAASGARTAAVSSAGGRPKVIGAPRPSCSSAASAWSTQSAARPPYVGVVVAMDKGSLRLNEARLGCPRKQNLSISVDASEAVAVPLRAYGCAASS
mmetsp:Transcript_57223/g.183891  ORF Transcript_57223/g.183891 Transcript_57223/m.183891 type:complete len:260 (+) Transcript_57223:238-1017(+)